MATQRRTPPLPAGDFLAWTARWNGFQAELKKPIVPREFRRGGSLAASWPKNATAVLRCDWKVSPALFDEFPTTGAYALCSRRVVDVLEQEALEHVEFLPTAVIDPRKKRLEAEYFIVHPTVPVDCLDLEKSGAKTSSIRKIAVNSVKRLVLDRKRLSAKARLFRIKEFARVLIIERSLAEKLREAKPDGVAFESLNKHWS